jgi:hypothetical protein
VTTTNIIGTFPGKNPVSAVRGRWLKSNTKNMSSHTTEKVIFIETKIIKLLKEEMYFFL